MVTQEEEKWETLTYQSGTHIVKKYDDIQTPHYYVYADKRYEVCKELQNWLNWDNDPDWRAKLVRCSSEGVDGPDGIHIYATGPFVLPPADNGTLNWQVDPNKKQDRIELIDKLME
jgi:hypothetical protein